MAGWVARTRPLAEPLSPRGPQPTEAILEAIERLLNGPMAPKKAVPGSWYGCPTRASGGLGHGNKRHEIAALACVQGELIAAVLFRLASREPVLGFVLGHWPAAGVSPL